MLACVPTQPRRGRPLRLECLEDRAVPATGTFVEDFSHDGNPRLPGFDSNLDKVLIAHYPRNASIVTTPAPVPPGKHALLLESVRTPFGGNQSGADYVTFGGLNSWEEVTSSSVTVMGFGFVTFYGKAGTQVFFDVDIPNAWRTLTVTAETVTDRGDRFGVLDAISFSTRGGLSPESPDHEPFWVDNVTARVGTGAPAEPEDGTGGAVYVNRFGNGLGVVGDADQNFVQVELLYDAAGTVRVSGPGQATKIFAGAGAVQIDAYTVEVPDFAHVQVFGADTNGDGRGEPLFDERDILVNLHGGDDQLIVAGAGWEGRFDLPSVDDLFVNVNGGDSLTVLTDVVLWDDLIYQARGGQDTLGVFGKSLLNGVQVNTGAGNDVVQFGTPGARVFDDEHPNGVFVWGLPVVSPQGVSKVVDRVDTGPGSDTVLVSGGHYENLSFILGGGADRIRFESAQDFFNGRPSIVVRPGGGADRVDVVDSQLQSMDLYQDDLDTVRVHRFFSQQITLRGAGGVRVQLPASGTEYRSDDFHDPTALPPGTLAQDALRVIFDGLTDRQRDRSSVAFGPVDF